MTKQLEEIFYPRSIAVVGASGDPRKMSYLTVAGFIDMGFKGEIYPVSRDILTNEINFFDTFCI